MADSADGAREPALGVPLSDRVAGEAQGHAQAVEAELRAKREILTADMLASLIAPRARLEEWWPRLQAGLFSIDGVLHGKKIRGALFAGECVLVYAVSEAGAQDLANRGLRSTIELLHEEFDTRNTRALRGRSPAARGLSRDEIGVGESGGRRARPSGSPDEALHRLPFLKDLLATEIGGLPWKG